VTVTPGRAREVEQLLGILTSWSRQRPDVVALALVGSWARGDARMDSDVDLIVLTVDPDADVDATDRIPGLVEGALILSRDWGSITERRVLLPSGLEVELGIGPSSWASTDPVDPGTARVVREGFRVLYDPMGLLVELAEVCGETG
jgi:predicted nucleotidyltransferase